MYQHSQIGRVTFVAMTPAVIIILFAYYATGEPTILLGGAFVVFMLMMFYKLTVSVTSETIIVKFGIGLIKKTIDFSDIDEVSPIKYPWFYGYGIRNIRNGWMFNVSGNRAVELKLKNGKRFWIGTDDPKGLERAIRNWMNM